MTVKYSDLVNVFESKGCKIITTEEEYNVMKGENKKVDIISSCGHENKQVHISLFKQKNTGTLCKDCIIKKRIETGKENSKNRNNYDAENVGYNLIKNACPNLDIINTNDGCLIDFLIKPKNETVWLPFQLKVTSKECYGLYTFGIKKATYENMLMIFICLENNKIWIMDNSLVNGKSTLSIGLKKSKYNEFEISLDILEEEFIKNYAKYNNYLIEQEVAMIPITPNSILEHKYRLLRTEKLPFLTFEKPEKGNQVYDFTVNGYKVQEKVATKFKTKNAYSSGLCKGNGSINKIQKRCCYSKGDNDFYWINIPNKNTFLLLPEEILIQNGYINGESKRKSLYISETIEEDNWLFHYMYSYETPNVEKIKSLFDAAKSR